jgi:hypothetical protein
MQNVLKSRNVVKNPSHLKWKYLVDSHGRALIRSNGSTYEYYDIYAENWHFDPYGSETFNGTSKDSELFHEISEKKVPGTLIKMCRGINDL